MFFDTLEPDRNALRLNMGTDSDSDIHPIIYLSFPANIVPKKAAQTRATLLPPSSLPAGWEKKGRPASAGRVDTRSVATCREMVRWCLKTQETRKMGAFSFAPLGQSHKGCSQKGRTMWVCVCVCQPVQDNLLVAGQHHW